RAFSEDMVDRVQTAIADKRWMADRIVRTELSQAYNRSHHSTLQYARDELGLGDEMKKSAMATFDARTDEDSFPVHGQVREIDEMFVDGDGRRYVHPPGRPNDREKEIPWMGEEGANRLAEMTSDNADTDVGASSSGGQFPPQGPYNDVKPGGRQLTDTGEGEYHGNYRLREDPEDGKTQTQLDERGWSPEDVSDVIAEPTRVYDTRDWRGDDMEPAIAYVREDGDYVVRNERTGYLVQISDRDDPDWLATWDYDVKPP
ncbi:MAG: colicin E5-related ribonuclease, partial [Bradymonadaceae bacterium]